MQRQPPTHLFVLAAFLCFVVDLESSTSTATLLKKFCTIWSSFLTASAGGPGIGRSLSSDILGFDSAAGSPLPWSEAPEPALARSPASRGLFVRDGFVWGDEAGEDVRGGTRGC